MCKQIAIRWRESYIYSKYSTWPFFSWFDWVFFLSRFLRKENTKLVSRQRTQTKGSLIYLTLILRGAVVHACMQVIIVLFPSRKLPLVISSYSVTWFKINRCCKLTEDNKNNNNKMRKTIFNKAYFMFLLT